MAIKMLKNSAGFTMIELMIALLIAALAVVGYIGANVATQQRAEELHERTIAIQDANRVIERMRNLAKTGTFPANVTTVFPHNNTVTGFGSLPPAAGEQISVRYADPSATTLLDVTIWVGWQSYTRRNVWASLRTYITQR